MWSSLLRSVVAFLLLLVIARWGVRRRLGKFGVFELLAVNTMGDLASHLAFETQHPLASGLISMLVFAGALIAMEMAGVRFKWAERLLLRQPEQLVENGRLNRQALSRARMTVDELEAELRKQGLQGVDEARSVILEPEGSLSVQQADSVKERLKQLAAALDELAERIPERQSTTLHRNL